MADEPAGRITDHLRHSLRDGTIDEVSLTSLVERFDDPETLASWANWEEVREREEIGFRLDLLAYAREMPDALHDFVRFFFLASDARSYQPAALAVGRHAFTHPALADHLEQYARRRHVALDGPLSFDGSRARRRLLLANVGRFASPHRPDDAPDALPLDADNPDAYLGPTRADAAVGMTATAYLLDRLSEPPDRLIALAWHLLEEAVDRIDLVGSATLFTRAWTRLLVELTERDADRAADIWRASASSVAGELPSPTARFAEHLAYFEALDAVLRAGIVSGAARLAGEPSVDRGPRRAEATEFLRRRLDLWDRRRRHTDAWAIAILRDGFRTRPGDPAGRPDDATGAEANEAAPWRGAAPDGEKTHTAFVDGVESLTDPGLWHRDPPRLRARTAFQLLDVARFGPVDRSEIAAVLRAHRLVFSAGPEPSATAPAGRTPLPGTAWPAFHRLLVDIFQIEEAPRDFPLETEHVQSMRSARMLLELVPAHRPAEFLDLIADAVEDHLRRRLASDPDFALRAFLFRLMARKPHRSLPKLLADRTAGRSYPGVDDLETRVRALEDEFATADEALDASPAAGADRWHVPLAATRRRLTDLQREGFVFSSVADLADFLDPNVVGDTAARRGYLQFVAEATPAGESILVDTSREVDPLAADALVADFERLADRLRTDLAELDPSAAFDLEQMREAGRHTSTALADLTDRLAGALPEHDRRLLEATTDAIDRRLRHWLTRVDQIASAAFEATGERGPDTDPADSDPAGVFTALETRDDETDEPAELEELLEAAYWIAAAPSRADDLPGHEPTDEAADSRARRTWLREVDVLETACEHAPAGRLDEQGRRQWQAFLRIRWETLLDDALQGGYGPDVERIALDSSLLALVDPDSQAAALRDARDWFLDRYHFRNVLPLERLRTDSGPAGAFAATTARFLGHYLEVWMALAVGALLLLDFGDAWIEMAGNRDYTGIAITFGAGLLGTYLYLASDLASKTTSPHEPAPRRYRLGRLRRTLGFLILCLAFAAGVTGSLWWLFSGTDAVLHGSRAPLQILVWTGFSLFVGVFFGLVTKEV